MHGQEDQTSSRLAPLSLAALGVVYGDIGTSPLYSFRKAVSAVSPDKPAVLGILSMIFWALTIIVSLKYLLLVMRADNSGEGGILALLALLNPWRGKESRGKTALIVLGVFGAALLYGDGIITPAISVLSAVSGIETVAKGIGTYVVPTTVAILLLLFAFQTRGTARVGALFGPVMLLWFIVIALLGLVQIVRHPEVLSALNPWYAVNFASNAKGVTLAVLGSVFLVVTGSEALYADMGHFGAAPIRVAWFACAYPCLLLNYFGQGALDLGDRTKAAESFYNLASPAARIPLIVLATSATVIASQAVISGAFSLTRQAVQLGQFPRVEIRQTSAEETGQIYVPAVNVVLAIATVGLVLGFRNSGNLAAAYGLAVSATMVITTLLTFFVMYKRWKWGLWVAIPITVALAVLDLAFLGANSLKILQGGWFPILVGGVMFLLMSTWAKGRLLLQARLGLSDSKMSEFVTEVKAHPVRRVPGTAVFMTAEWPQVPAILRHQIRHNQILHEQVILLTVYTEDIPRIGAQQRLEIEDLGQGFHRIGVHYGFMQAPDVPVALRLAGEFGLDVDFDKVTYFVGRETVVPSDEALGMAPWREKLFEIMSRNAVRATAFYKLPARRVFELGIHVKI